MEALITRLRTEDGHTVEAFLADLQFGWGLSLNSGETQSGRSLATHERRPRLPKSRRQPVAYTGAIGVVAGEVCGQEGLLAQHSPYEDWDEQDSRDQAPP